VSAGGAAFAEPIGQRLESGETVLREVGRGALARVYLVSDGVVPKALKLLPAGQAARADHEYTMAHDLDHPHLGRVEARVDLVGRPGLLMPWASGRRLLVRDRTPRERVAYLDAFGQLLAALAAFHARGRVHRDVKPENVLIDRAGHVRLIDFDLAVSAGAPERAPRAAGTLAYLSPEQARGEPASPASDLYAAGVMLYAALTGEVPFHGTVEQLLADRRGGHAAPPRPSAIDPGLAAADALTARLLAPNPGDRFPSADHAAASLRSLRAGWAVAAGGDAGAS
jgi:eukaryotic-like serine/threonine-protein kinase